MASNSNEIPFYHVEGTHYECSLKIGSICRDLILKRIEVDRDYLTPLFEFVRTEEGRKLHQGFVDAIKTTFPWYWDEIRGLVDGCGVSLDEILVLNFENETKTAHQFSLPAESRDDEPGAKGCSTVLINRLDTNTLSIVHNEDNTAGLYDTGYLIEAKIHSSTFDNGTRQSPEEHFIAYCYAGVIPGIAFGVNKHGFVYGLNALYPNFVGKNKIPRLIFNRALLSISSEDQLDETIEKVPIAYAFTINGAFLQSKDDKSVHLLNYELSPTLETGKNFVDKCVVLNSEQENPSKNCQTLVRNYLNHFNHFERCKGTIVERETLLWSKNRGRRALEIGEIRTTDDAFRLLSDRADEKYPIFFVAGTTEINLATLCTIHFDLYRRKLSIYRSDWEKPKFIFNLDDLSRCNE